MRSFIRILGALPVLFAPAFADVMQIDFAARITSGRFILTDAGGSDTEFPVAAGTPLTGTVFVNLDTAPAPVSSVFDSSNGPVLATDLTAPTPLEWLHMAVSFPLPAFPPQDPPLPLNTAQLPVPATQPAGLNPIATQQISFNFIPNRGLCCDSVVMIDSVAQLLLDGDTQISYVTQIAMIMASFNGFLPGAGIPESFVMTDGASNGFFSHRRSTLLANGDRLGFDGRVDFLVTGATATTVPEPGTIFAGIAALGVIVARYRTRRARSRLLS